MKFFLHFIQCLLYALRTSDNIWNIQQSLICRVIVYYLEIFGKVCLKDPDVITSTIDVRANVAQTKGMANSQTPVPSCRVKCNSDDRNSIKILIATSVRKVQNCPKKVVAFCLFLFFITSDPKRISKFSVLFCLYMIRKKVM